MKKILRLVAGVFFATAAALYLPSASGVLFLLCAIIALPIPKISDALKKYFGTFIPVGVCITLFLFGTFIAPDVSTKVVNPASGNDVALLDGETKRTSINKSTKETETIDPWGSHDIAVETKSKPETEPETEPEPKEVKYKSGQYKVGVDMPAGEYCLYDDGGLFSFPSFTLSVDANADEIIEWHTFSKNYLVEVQDGEYFKLSDCYAVPYNGEKIAALKSGYLCEGFYAVGIDIPAGEYKVTEDADAIVASITTYSDLRGDMDDWFVLDGDRYIELKEGQYVSVSDCKIYVGE